MKAIISDVGFTLQHGPQDLRISLSAKAMKTSLNHLKNRIEITIN